MPSSSSRLANTARNIRTGLLNQIVIIGLSFITRTVFIRTLGVEYLGVSGLFYNILQVLSMADLGFGAAIVYSMYRPLAENDKAQLAALMNYYKRLYRVIAVIVAAIGLALAPFLKYIINTASLLDNLTLYYLLYLANTVFSYLFVYKASITTADQKTYLLNLYATGFCIIQNAAQLVILLFFRNFTAYLAIQLLCTFSQNLYKGWRSEKMYPFIKEKAKLSREVKKEIGRNVGAMSIYKIGGVLLNNTDNILISMMIGTIWVGYYSNYYMIVNNVNIFVNILFTSSLSSIGNLNVSTEKDHQYKIFLALQMAAWWLAAFCSVCFLILFQDFIMLWLGNGFLLDTVTLTAIAANFYLTGTLRTVSVFRDTTGMFRETRYVFLGTCVLNLIFSILMGKVWGLPGILMATAIARILTNYWFEPKILMNKYFSMPSLPYYRRQGVYFLLFLLSLACTYAVCGFIPSGMVAGFILKLAACAVIPNAIFLLFLFRGKEFQYFYSKIRGCKKKSA